jgi:hypothetical protein
MPNQYTETGKWNVIFKVVVIILLTCLVGFYYANRDNGRYQPTAYQGYTSVLDTKTGTIYVYNPSGNGKKWVQLHSLTANNIQSLQ